MRNVSFKHFIVTFLTNFQYITCIKQRLQMCFGYDLCRFNILSSDSI